jgi:hypothetical protein
MLEINELYMVEGFDTHETHVGIFVTLEAAQLDELDLWDMGACATSCISKAVGIKNGAIAWEPVPKC